MTSAPVLMQTGAEFCRRITKYSMHREICRRLAGWDASSIADPRHYSGGDVSPKENMGGGEQALMSWYS